MEERIYNRRTAYYLINVKARRNQKPQHYVEAFRNLVSHDPLVQFHSEVYGSVRRVEEGELDKEGLPYWMNLSIITYTIIDPKAFYNRRNHQDIEMAWDSDIVANKKEANLYLIPKVHIVALKKSSTITLNRVFQYLQDSLNRIEDEGFDVTIIPDSDEVQRILEAYSIIRIDASLTYSNPLGGHSSLFRDAFDDKIRESCADEVSISLQGSTNNPLQAGEDSLVEAIVNQARTGNGTVDATVKMSENSPLTHIDSSDHPRILMIEQYIRNIGYTLYNRLVTLFP